MQYIYEKGDVCVCAQQPPASWRCEIVIAGGERQEAEALAEALPECGIVAWQVGDWDTALTPWPAPGLRKGQSFGDGAGETLAALERALPEIEGVCGICAPRVIMGYSLGGLFALWASTRSAMFAGCGSVSGSLWYDGLMQYIDGAEFRAKYYYLSLGDREPKGRSPRLAAVGDGTSHVVKALEARGVDSFFEWNEGNHFNDPAGRMLKCARYLLNKLAAPCK